MKTMKHYKWEISLGIGLVVLSAGLYFLHYAVFKDAHHIFIYLLGDIAFLPIEVLLVAVIIHRLLTRRERQVLFEKLNMVIGAFFNEVGAELLAYVTRYDNNFGEIRKVLLVRKDWTKKDFVRAARMVEQWRYDIDSKKGDLQALKDFLVARRVFLLGLLENPVLLEHQKFTDLLWAVFHLTDELAHRKILTGLPQRDYEHISGDITRAYRVLLAEWLDYMSHLQSKYPYLFSLALRTDPFDPDACVEIAA
jgi:hypothetical protein